MERRLAAVAGADAAPLTRRAAIWLAALALVAPAGADARPSRRDARAQFDRGLAAYKKANYEGAAEALEKAFALEADVDTLFAWAQAERKLERCDKAIELYQKALAFKLPDANRLAIQRSIADCRALLVSQAPPPAPEPLPVINPPPEPQPEVAVPAPSDAAPAVGAARPGDSIEPPHHHAWYRDPITLTLLGSGLVATGVGTGLLISARSLDQDFHKATTELEASQLADKAHSRGNAGLITAGIGGALVVGGVVWLLTHRHADEPRAVSAWLAPSGGGVALTRSF